MVEEATRYLPRLRSGGPAPNEVGHAGPNTLPVRRQGGGLGFAYCLRLVEPVELLALLVGIGNLKCR